jgi:hypothetical protein
MRLIILVTAMALASAGCAHTQRPEHPIHVVSEDAEDVGTALGSGGAGGHDCQKEHEECVELCWKKRYPWPHNPQQAGWYYKRCVSDCKDQYNECVDEQEEAAREREKTLKFSRMEQAIEWIREHKAEVVLGTIVIIGGVAFVLTTGGSGALILAPLAL